MPLYDYICDGGHKFEARAGYDEDVISCKTVVARGPAAIVVRCMRPAYRDPVPKIAGVIFSGPGFTRTGA